MGLSLHRLVVCLEVRVVCSTGSRHTTLLPHQLSRYSLTLSIHHNSADTMGSHDNMLTAGSKDTIPQPVRRTLRGSFQEKKRSVNESCAFVFYFL